MARLLPLVLLFALLVGVGGALGAELDEEPGDGRVPVPDVRGVEAREAVRLLIEAGLDAGRLYDRVVPSGWPLGVVVQQAPPPDQAERPSRRRPGTEVHLRIAAASAGDPMGRAVPAAWLDPGKEEAVLPAPVAPVAAAGSPDGDAVPPVEGLLLVEAEQLCRRRGLTLHVDRVAGHPVGRILTQDPAAGSPALPGGTLRVRVAAGGDVPGAVAPAPAIQVTRLAVPDLLDRTWPQAERILAELGFGARREEAAHGPPDRVADQAPPAGTPLVRGEVVVVRVAPPRAARTLEPGPPVPAVSPQPISPGPDAPLGEAPTLLLGFTWHPVEGAEAYVVEVEEAAGEAWLGAVRQVVRRSAVLLNVERLGTPPGAIRWRVAAVLDGRTASPSAWTEIR